MSNVITLNVPPRRVGLHDRAAGLIDCFARHRRVMDDVFWLKENAELLNILECTGQQVAPTALEPLARFYDSLADRLSFFPQYYRFLLSIGLDLEALGIGGSQMERLCAWVAQTGLVEAELSDLQRAEARRLLARRGIGSGDPTLDIRLRAFIDRPATFALPNKKAAYELTHIVFYLSEYGRRDPQLSPAACLSLEYAGILAFLDQNMDLLAEICVALRQAGKTPSAVWEGAVRAHAQAFVISAENDAPLSDGYHAYLVSTWAVAMMGQDDRASPVPTGRCVFTPGRQVESALRPMSAVLMALADARQTSWSSMRDAIYETITPEAATVIEAARASSRAFDAFFENFARAPMMRG
ncbi:DUF6902 family protein [Tateyamaria sp. SN6-1]|uniref:DUF6902 family protein n=1 Tax=Tateyamaria sp. SN6-1 TaxID=3092148 RepID=UPI0039F47D71